MIGISKKDLRDLTNSTPWNLQSSKIPIWPNWGNYSQQKRINKTKTIHKIPEKIASLTSSHIQAE